MALVLPAFSYPLSYRYSRRFSSTRHRRFKPIAHASSQISLHSPLSNNQNPPSPSSCPKNTGVIIIGAGLAGLAAATRLQAENIPFHLLEASDAVGGRVRSDKLDGFTLDRGFQIFITAYPEAKKLLDYTELNLHNFYSGAQIFYDGRFHTVADPLRHFSDSLLSLANPIGSVVDKILIGLTRLRVLLQSDDKILSAKEEVCTIDLLRNTGFSESILDRFFRPFFGGIFFDTQLETTSRLFNFIFKCLALGENTLPANGISAIPEQLARKLPSDSISFNSKAISIDIESESSYTVTLENGESVKSELGIIVAVEEFEVLKLLPEKKLQIPLQVKKQARSTVCLYFSMDKDKVPVKDPVLFLNGTGKGTVNNMFYPTNVAPSYAPQDKALISVSLVGLYDDITDEDLVKQVVKELEDWFGERVVSLWSYMRMYRIKFAQPNQSPPTDLFKDPRFKLGVYMCGDYVTNATFDGALVSGRKAVEALLKDRALLNV